LVYSWVIGEVPTRMYFILHLRWGCVFDLTNWASLVVDRLPRGDVVFVASYVLLVVGSPCFSSRISRESPTCSRARPCAFNRMVWGCSVQEISKRRIGYEREESQHEWARQLGCADGAAGGTTLVSATELKQSATHFISPAMLWIQACTSPSSCESAPISHRKRAHRYLQ